MHSSRLLWLPLSACLTGGVYPGGAATREPSQRADLHVIAPDPVRVEFRTSGRQPARPREFEPAGPERRAASPAGSRAPDVVNPPDRGRAEGGAPASQAEAQNLFVSVLRRHAAYRDFEVSFVQTPVSRATGEGDPESGIVSYLRPGLWRWEYRSPERKLVIVRGRTAAVHVEDDADVSRYDLSEGAGGSSIGTLLAGGESVAKAFRATFEPAGAQQEKGETVLRLVPAGISEQFDRVLLRIRTTTLAIVEATVVDPGGNSLRFRFGKFHVDRGLRESSFELPATRPANP